MTELSNAVGRELVESITSLVKPKSNGETRRGDVTRVVPGGRTWVRIEGNEFDTCCTRSSVACKPGDSVLVSIRNNRSTIEGNYTSPATDDSKAIEAIKTGSSAQQTADMAHELATNAIADAQATRDAAERAEADATRAAVAAESSEASARASAASAASAADSAASAAASAFSANESAESAYLAALGSITSLGTVENVIESLRWLKDNPAYKKCPDGKYIDPTCDYYQIVDGEYVKVENPVAEGIPTYYVIDATATAAAYVDSKLAVTDAGLYVTKDKLLTWAEGDEMPDGSGTIGAPELDEEGNPVLDDEGNPVIIGADLIGRPKPQEAGYVLLGVDGVTIYSKEGYPVATYGSSMKLGYGASSTTIESDMIEVIRTDIPTKVEYNVFAAGRRLANPEQPESPDNPMLPFVQFSDGYGHDLFCVDSTGKPTFAKPVPIPSGGTDATNEGDAADNLMVQSIGAGMEIPAGTDLNTLTTPGNYVCGFTSNVAGFANKPAPLTNAFRLTVFKILGNTEHSANEGHRGQLIMDWTSGREYYRVYNASSGLWGSWRTKRQDTDIIDVLHGGHGGTTVRAAAQNLLVPSLVGSTYLGENTDLNTVVRFGTYYCTGSAVVKTWKNCPTNAALRMTVANGTGQSYDTATLTSVYLVQEIVDLYAYVYRRYSSNGGSTWGEWARSIVSSDVIDRQHGGTGKNITSDPSMLVNLASDSAGLVFVSAPRPGVTGILPLSHGGLGSNTAAGGRSTLGLTYEGVYQSVQFATIAPGANGTKCTLIRRGTCCSINLNGVGIYGASSSSRTKIGTVPAGYRPAGSFYSWPFLIDSSGNFYCDMDAYSGYVTSWEVFTYPIGG